MEQFCKKLQIFVCTHKESEYTRTTPPYIPIQAGKEINKELNLGFINDNTGDNISSKNKSWNELSVIYWIWKNVHDTEYIGLCHYRRYFNLDINENNIDKLLRNKDAITIDKIYGPKAINRNGLILATSQEDFYIFLDTLLAMHPEYEVEIKNYFYNYHFFTPF